MSEVEDYAKELKEQYNTAVKITEEEYKEIIKALNFYNDVGDSTRHIAPAYGEPYTEVCIVHEKLDKGIIKLAIMYQGAIYDEKEFRKNPYTESFRGLIDRIKAFLYDNLMGITYMPEFTSQYET